MELIRIEGLIRKEAERTTLNIPRLSILRGVRLGIMGENGSGKSSLLKSIAGLLQPSAGSVYFDGKRVEGPDEVLLPGHKKIAYLSQHFELLNNYKIWELLEMSNKIDEAAAQQLFRICRIDHLLNRKSNEVSGGERQRIALARTLTSEPELLLLDEPYSNLDLISKNNLIKVVQDIGNTMNITIALVTHDPEDILSWAERLLVIRNGSIEQDDTPSHIFHYPNNEYVAGIMGSNNAEQ
jgi:ABC-type sugar transport system ATPase subunit